MAGASAAHALTTIAGVSAARDARDTHVTAFTVRATAVTCFAACDGGGAGWWTCLANRLTRCRSCRAWVAHVQVAERRAMAAEAARGLEQLETDRLRRARDRARLAASAPVRPPAHSWTPGTDSRPTPLVPPSVGGGGGGAASVAGAAAAAHPLDVAGAVIAREEAFFSSLAAELPLPVLDHPLAFMLSPPIDPREVAAAAAAVRRRGGESGAAAAAAGPNAYGRAPPSYLDAKPALLAGPRCVGLV